MKVSALHPAPNRRRRLLALAAYAAIAAASYSFATLARYDFRLPPDAVEAFLFTLPLVLAVRLSFSLGLGLCQGRWRFASTHDMPRLLLATTAGTLTLLALSWGTPFIPVISRAVLAMEWVVTSYLTAGAWLTYRTALEQYRRLTMSSAGQERRVLIVGAGEAASLLCREMMRLPGRLRPVAFVDDDPTKWNTRVHSLPVLGGTAHVPEICATERIHEIAIAIPSARPPELRRIVEACESARLPMKVLPGISEVIAGIVRLDFLRDLRIEDLLGREPINLELPELRDDMSGRAVLVTGAAGSIGSELSRQVALHGPAALVCVDQSETALFFLERELRAAHPDMRMEFVVGDIVDPITVERIFADHRPFHVFHAAAYKHVPLMQLNVRDAIRNNVLGTLVLADAAGRHGAARFVLVSTDKAVRPTSIMGATKRLAEIVTLGSQNHYPRTCYAAVRFGNVLGSNGSVIPIFCEQIRRGEPLTVTHPEATRYFMTIPEAVQLILQTSLLPEVRGHIAMLEMGDPVRIADLACNLLRISGSPPQEGTNLVFTGLRPGEKLHEELAAPDEISAPASIPKVQIVAPSRLTIVDVRDCLRQWEQSFAQRRDRDVLEALNALFPQLEIPGDERQSPRQVVNA